MLLPQVAQEYRLDGGAISGRNVREGGLERDAWKQPERAFRRLRRKSSAKRNFSAEPRARQHGSSRETGLLEFDVVAGVNLAQAESDEHGRSIWCKRAPRFLHRSLPAARCPICISRERFRKPYILSKASALGLIRGFVLGALVAEDAEIVADFHALGVAEVHVDDVVGAVKDRELLAGDHHRDGLAAGRREAVEVVLGLQGRLGPLIETAARYRRAACSRRNSRFGRWSTSGLRDNDAQAAFVLPHRAHLA